MSFREYEVVDDPAGRAGRQLDKLARTAPWSASRLLTAVEDFIRDGLLGGDRLAGAAGGAVEVYLVPPRFVLAHLPDAAALIRVDHAGKRIEFVRIIASCGGPGETQWAEIEAMAEAALG